MGKYEPLGSFLKNQKREQVAMTFAEIEKIIGSKLPNSKQFRAWWSNNPWNNVMTRQWLDAGYQTEAVDVVGEKLVFRRVVAPSPNASSGSRRKEQGPFPIEQHPGFGFMKGLIKIEEGFDITGPFADEKWDEGYLGVDER